MKDYMITIVAVFLMVLGMLLCHKYTLNSKVYNDVSESSEIESEESSRIPFINTAPSGFNNTKNNNNNIAVTTAPPQNIVTAPLFTTDVSDYPESYPEESQQTTVTTVRRSILENATAVNTTTVHQFSIIQNPQQIPQTQTTPVMSDDFSLIID